MVTSFVISFSSTCPPAEERQWDSGWVGAQQPAKSQPTTETEVAGTIQAVAVAAPVIFFSHDYRTMFHHSSLPACQYFHLLT